MAGTRVVGDKVGRAIVRRRMDPVGDQLGPLLDDRLIQQVIDRDIHEIGVREIVRAVGEGMLEGLDEQVRPVGVHDRVGKVVVACFKNHQGLQHRHPPAAGRGHGNHASAFDLANQRLALIERVTRKLLARHLAAGFRDGPHDCVTHRATIEAVDPIAGDALQRLGLQTVGDAITQLDLTLTQEVRPDQPGPLLELGMGLELLHQRSRHDHVVLINHKPLIRGFDRRGEHGLAVERAVGLQRVQQARDRAGDRDGRPADGARFTRAFVVVRINIRLLAIVDGRVHHPVLWVVGQVDDHEPATADPAGVGTHDAEGERRGDRGIDGVAAHRQHACPCLRSNGMVRGDGPLGIDPVVVHNHIARARSGGRAGAQGHD